MKISNMCGTFFLGVLALAGCQERRQVSVTNVECRDRPPASNNESFSLASSSGMTYAGFQLGESATAAEDRIAQHSEWTSVNRADCGGVWFVRAGTTASQNSAAVCDIHGQNECELLMATFRRTASQTHALTNMTHVKRLEKQGRPTHTVISELNAQYGEPLWQYAVRRSRGWPSLIEETWIVWSTHGSKPATPVSSNFAAEVIEQLGAGDYAIVRLLHNEDHRFTYAITAELRRVADVGARTKAPVR